MQRENLARQQLIHHDSIMPLLAEFQQLIALGDENARADRGPPLLSVVSGDAPTGRIVE